MLVADSKTAPDEHGVLVIDEHGDRKWGKKTAHVGKQYPANIGKVQGGVVSVSSLWADEEVYYPLEVDPYTPAHHFEQGTLVEDSISMPANNKPPVGSRYTGCSGQSEGHAR